MSRFTRRGRAALRNCPPIGIPEITNLATLGLISRSDAERELRRTVVATWPKDVPTELRDSFLNLFVGQPLDEWNERWLQILTGLGMPTPIAVELPDGRVVAYVANRGPKS